MKVVTQVLLFSALMVFVGCEGSKSATNVGENADKSAMEAYEAEIAASNAANEGGAKETE